MIKILALLTAFCLCLSSIHKHNLTSLSKMLDTLDQNFQEQFSNIDLRALQKQRVGEYVCIYGRAQLYGMLSSPPSIIEGFSFIKIAAEHFQIPECMHLLGVMYNFKMTPLFNLQESVLNNSLLDQYIKRSHLKNSEMFWYLSSLKQHMPSTMVLGNLNHVGLSTKVNCTTAASYYRMIIEKVFIEDYEKHGYYRDRTSIFEEQLYLKQQLQFNDEADESYMIEEALNLGQESFSSNFNIAQNYYYGKNGFLRNTTKAAEMFERLKQIGNSESASLLGLCYFKGEGVPKDYAKAHELFKASKNLDLSRYMLNVMELFGIHVKKNKEAVIKRLKSEIKDNYHSKGLYGALILKGEVPSEEKMTGMVLLQESSNYGFSVSKLLLGLTFLDGIDIPYSCPKAITLIREGLMSVDLWADKTEEAKRAIKKQKYVFALVKYMELSLTGSSVGLVNGLFLLEIYLKQLQLDSWDHQVIATHPVFQHLQTIIPNLDAEQLLFGDVYQIISKQEARPVLLNNTKNYISYVKTKMLTICKNGGVTICMFLSYKENPTNKRLLKDLAKREGEKLHLLQARFLLGQYYQQANDTQSAIAEYSRATSSLLAPLLLIIQGYQIEMNVKDDLILLLTVVAIAMAGSVIHRNMIIIQKHKEQQQKQQREERRLEEQEIQRRASNPGAPTRTLEQRGEKQQVSEQGQVKAE